MDAGETIQPAAVHRFAAEVLQALGMRPSHAETVADSMVWAGLHGRVSHSLIRLVPIAERARAGGLNLRAEVATVRDHGVTAVLDAGYTWGALAGAVGMRRAVDKAQQSGIGVAVVRNCDNTGALSWYTSIALEAHVVGMAISNTEPLLPVWGGAHKLIGNQPMSFAVPAGRYAPIVVDQMLASERLDVLRVAAQEERQLPPGVLVDAAGRPTTEARAFTDGGAVLPMGRHRGSALALVFEVLTGLLSGGLIMSEIGGGHASARTGYSLFLMAMEPAAFFGSYEDFGARVDQLIEMMHDAEPAPGTDRVRVPGEHRARLAEERRHTGIPFSGDDVRQLRALAADVAVDWPGAV